jgi:hypothetical protein
LLRVAAKTAAPSWIIRAAIARPMPDAAPVTTAVRALGVPLTG